MDAAASGLGELCRKGVVDQIVGKGKSVAPERGVGEQPADKAASVLLSTSSSVRLTTNASTSRSNSRSKTLAIPSVSATAKRRRIQGSKRSNLTPRLNEVPR
ncbi:MAG: hypothetical protein ACI8Y4_002219 [Candidatus Poriferisodalaceae bacterium]|jgi:hypothetical protein